MSKMLDAALAYAALGFSVIPCWYKQKKPIGEWKEYQSKIADKETITGWFEKNPDANLAIICGKVSGNLAVIDFDSVPEYKAFEEGYWDLVKGCPIVKTGRGYHIYIRTMSPIPTNKIVGGDLKGEGGCVMAPPSVHESGAIYKLVEGDFSSIPIVDVESLGLLEPVGGKKVIELLPDSIPEGQRHNELFLRGCSLRGKGLEEPDILAALREINRTACKLPLSEEEIETLAKSIGKYERGSVNGQGLDAPLEKDRGHAEILATELKGKYRWATNRRRWMQYNGKVWSITTDEVVGLAASNVLVEVYKEKYLAAGRDTQQMKQYNTLTKEACTGTRIQGALYFLKGTEGFSTEPKQWNANPWLFNVNNGTIDLKTRKLLEHNPDDLLTMISPIDFDEDTSSMDWYEFLRFFLPNREIRRQIQRDIGLALPGVALEEALPFWWGTGGNGKSTASRILSEIFGSYAKKAAPNLLVKSKYEGHPTELADLAGSRLVFAIETEKGSCLAETRVKELTGGDTVKARWMYGDFFEFSKTFSIFLITNDKPKIQGTDNSIWRRMRLIPWTKTVSSEERKPQAEVVEHLIHGSVGSSILSWALDGLADWEEDHTWIAQEVKAITADYRQESDRLGAFLKECCDIGETYKVAVADLHQRYVDWCKEVEEEELDRIHFGKQLKESARVIQKKSNSVCCWNGIRLKRM